MSEPIPHPPVVDPETGAPLAPRAKPGYYGKFDVMSQQKFWDAKTRAVVVDRVENVPALRHFDEAAAAFWYAVFEQLIPQSDRTPERRIPIVPRVDERLFEGTGPGYRFADMPHDAHAYELGREAIDAEANDLGGAPFVQLDPAQQSRMLERIHAGEPRAAAEIWERMGVKHFWSLIVNDAVEAYYAHPWSWDEIGFGGPAYPRGYMRLEEGRPEPWETDEKRYAWAPPPGIASGEKRAAS